MTALQEVAEIIINLLIIIIIIIIGGACLPHAPVPGAGGSARQTRHLGLGRGQGVAVSLQLGGLKRLLEVKLDN